MALLTASDLNDLDTRSFLKQSSLSGNLVAGEALLAKAPCYINADGMIYMANGTADNAAARAIGVTPKSYNQGDYVTLAGPGTIIGYTASGVLTPGALYYVAATAGRIDDTATVGDASGTFFALSDTELVFMAYKKSAAV